MSEKEFERLLATIRQADLTAEQRRKIAEAVKLPRGRPKREPTMETHGPRYDAVIAMRREQAAGATYEKAAEIAMRREQAAGATYEKAAEIAAQGRSPETVKSWAKRDGLREMADLHLRAEQRFHELLELADSIGIAYGPGWSVSRIRKAIEEAEGKK